MRAIPFIAFFLACMSVADAQEALLPQQDKLLSHASGFEDVVSIIAEKGHPETLYVAERSGRVRIVTQGKVERRPLLDIEAILSPDEGSEISSVILGPSPSQSKVLLISYTDKQGDTILGRFQTKDTETADEDDLVVMLKVVQPSPYKHRSTLALGPDKLLYIGLGDSPRTAQAQSLSQNHRSLFGKILRIDISDPSSYRIPATNPFPKGSDTSPEVWALGFQEPRYLSFDPMTNRLFAIDAGRTRQEVNIVERGRNYGWNLIEGTECVAKPCDPKTFIPPAYEIVSDSNLIGGFIYRGNAMSELQGAYIFGESGSAQLFALSESEGTWVKKPIVTADSPILAIGEGGDNEVYIATKRGLLLKLSK